MKNFDIPSKEELEHFYIEENLTKEDLSKKYNVGLTTISRWVSKYKICKPASLVKEAQRKTLLSKYNVQNVSQIKSVRDKAKATMLSRYGVENPSYSKVFRDKAEETLQKRFGVRNASYSEELKQKRVDTCKKHFGVSYPMQSEEVRDKSKSTCIDKYGVDHVSKCKDIISKSQNTCMERYGVPVFAKSDLYKDRRKKTCLEKYHTYFPSQAQISKESLDILNDKEKLESLINNLHSKTFHQISVELGISDRTAAKYVRDHNLDHLMDGTVSSQEQEIKELLKDVHLESTRSILDGQEIDLYSPEHKIGIEFNGNYWHSDLFRDKYYHYNKSKLAKEKGVFIFHIFEYEWNDERTKKAIINRLKNLFNNNNYSIFARKCTIKEVSSKEAKEFLDNNHVQGYAPSQIRIGLYYKDELVSLIEFITNGLNKNYQYELSRFCSKSGCNVVGGASKLFNHFIKTYNPTSVISYSDIAKTTGKIYETLGFKNIGISKPQYHWINSSVALTRYQCQLKELRKRGWLLPNEKKSESQVMREHGFSKLYDCGKKVWVWK